MESIEKSDLYKNKECEELSLHETISEEGERNRTPTKNNKEKENSSASHRLDKKEIIPKCIQKENEETNISNEEDGIISVEYNEKDLIGRKRKESNSLKEKNPNFNTNRKTNLPNNSNIKNKILNEMIIIDESSNDLIEIEEEEKKESIKKTKKNYAKNPNISPLEKLKILINNHTFKKILKLILIIKKNDEKDYSENNSYLKDSEDYKLLKELKKITLFISNDSLCLSLLENLSEKFYENKMLLKELITNMKEGSSPLRKLLNSETKEKKSEIIELSECKSNSICKMTNIINREKKSNIVFKRHYFNNHGKIYSFKPTRSKINNFTETIYSCSNNNCNAKLRIFINKKKNKVETELLSDHIGDHAPCNAIKLYYKFPELRNCIWSEVQIASKNEEDFIYYKI